MSTTTLNYFDVTYITPSGTEGTHYAVKASSIQEAIELTPIMLAYGTPWHPDEFKVVSAKPSDNPPR